MERSATSGKATKPYRFAGGNQAPSGLHHLGRASSAAPAGCYAKKAWEDTDNSLKDRAKDLNSCRNPYAWAPE